MSGPDNAELTTIGGRDYLVREPAEVEKAKALNRVADAIERLADAYIYCNQPEGDEVEAPDPDAKPLPPGYRGMR